MKITGKQELMRWIALMGEEHNLIAPTDKDGVLLYQKIESPEDIIWDFLKPVNSIKDVFFPQTEIIAEMSSNGQGIGFHEVISDEKTILITRIGLIYPIEFIIAVLPA